MLVIQPQHNDGPSFLTTWLQAQGIAHRIVRIEAGEPLPADLRGVAALAMLGGAMSANDPLPWLRQAEVLMREAVQAGVPVLGHCLGGQLLARALGAPVLDNPEPEIGWTTIERHAHPLAEAWLGPVPTLPVYQWHFQSFELPPGATLLAGNAACARQAFALGPHLGMQFHIEVDAPKLQAWRADLPPPGDPLYRFASVQTPQAHDADTQRHLASSQATAARVYARWWGGRRG